MLWGKITSVYQAVAVHELPLHEDSPRPNDKLFLRVLDNDGKVPTRYNGVRLCLVGRDYVLQFGDVLIIVGFQVREAFCK